MRLETEVRTSFDRMTRRLREMALATGDSATVQAAVEGDTFAVRRLLTSTAAIVSRDAPYDTAITIYGSDGEPVAWAGRPTDLPAFASLGRRGVVRVRVRMVLLREPPVLLLDLVLRGGGGDSQHRVVVLGLRHEPRRPVSR